MLIFNHRKKSMWLMQLITMQLVLGGVSCSMPGFDANTKMKSDIEGGEMQNSEILTFKAKVVRFKRNSIHDDFIDGSSKSYDSSDLVVIEPESFKGKVITIQHDIAPELGNVFTVVGSELTFELDKRLILNESYYVNAGMLAINAIDGVRLH